MLFCRDHKKTADDLLNIALDTLNVNKDYFRGVYKYKSGSRNNVLLTFDSNDHLEDFRGRFKAAVV